MCGPFTHAIDPILLDGGAIYLWWYGLSYALGFAEMHLFLWRGRARLGLDPSQVYSFSLLFIVCVLLGGRIVEVAFDEWPFYREHPALIPAYWLGGMASHGLLLGAAASIWVFSRLSRVSVRRLADELVIPGAFLLGIGRIGNFIDGQIVGRVTDACWGVRFPDAEGFRHPVVLYDGAKNLALIPLLLWIRTRFPRPGTTAAHFIFWYAFLRLFVDVFRDYPTHRLGMPTGQTFNALMAALGMILLFRAHVVRRNAVASETSYAGRRRNPSNLGWKRAALASLLLFSLAIPGNWTQDVPSRYGKRHPGLRHSIFYPRLETAPPTPQRENVRTREAENPGTPEP